MKVIHTADWHLGKILNGKQFLEDQHYILNKLIDNLKEEKPDVLVISGDIYDTSYPSKETIRLFEETIKIINVNMKIPTIITNGNHDGRERLNYGSTWFEFSQLYIRTQLELMSTPITINNINFTHFLLLLLVKLRLTSMMMISRHMSKQLKSVLTTFRRL